MILASLIGGFYGVISVFVSLNPIMDCFLFVLIAVIICYISFYEKSVKRLIGSLMLYLLTSCILGGVMSALYSLFNRLLANYLSQYSFENAYTGARFFIIASISIMISMLFSKTLMKKKEITEVQLEIIYKGEKFNLIGLCDSGNLLSEPITGKAVVLISQKNRLSKSIDLNNEKHVRYIPYSDASTNGMLKGVIPDKITINDNSVDAIIAPVNKESFGEYEAIVPASLV